VAQFQAADWSATVSVAAFLEKMQARTLALQSKAGGFSN
jgi:hypothetical protein